MVIFLVLCNVQIVIVEFLNWYVSERRFYGCSNLVLILYLAFKYVFSEI